MPASSSHTTAPETFGPHLAELRRNPYSVYRRFRERDPVHWGTPGVPRDASEGTWYLFRHRDVQQALKSPHLGRRAHEYLPPGPLGVFMSRWLVFRNPPDHTRIRQALRAAFVPTAIRRLEHRTRELAQRLVDSLEEGAVVDLLEAVASPIPTLVVAELLGVPVDDHPIFRTWSNALAPSLDITYTPGQLQRAYRAAREMYDYLGRAADRRRREPGDDLLSRLVAEDAEIRLETDELLTNCVFLLAAGHETTVQVLGTGIRALLQDGAAWQELVADPAKVPAAVDELLRWEAPIQITFRDVLEDTEIAGVPLRAGQQVGTILGAANRDPERFPDPDRLLVTRADALAHTSFSGGIHFCIGAALARMEIAITLGRIVERWPRLELAGQEARWRPSVLLRGLESLPVRPCA
jgi:cytochrome P450